MDDFSLIKSLQNGDAKAFETLVAKYQVKVYNTIIGFVKSAEDAEDLSQEVFIEIFVAVKGFRGDAKMSTWIYRIAVNKSLEFIRKKKRQKRFAFLTNLFESADKEVAPMTNFIHPGIQLENKEKASVLFEAIGNLPENQQVAFTLHKVEGLSYQEISKIMGVSLSSVESLMFRAKKNLKKMLYDYYKKE